MQLAMTFGSKVVPPGSPEARAREKRRTRIGLAVIILVPITIMVFVFGFRYPAPGAAIAETNLTSGQPFSLTYVADGNDNRVWLDLDCTFCGRIDGEIVASAGGDTQRKQLDEDIVEYGHTRSVVVSGDSRLVADGHLLLEMPKRAAGVEVTISGTVRMKPGGPGQQRIQKMRLWIAD